MAAGTLARRPERVWLAALAALLGALPDHIGQFRLASAVLRRLRPGHEVVLQRMRGGLRVGLDLGDRTQGLAYLTRRYEPELTDFIVQRLPPGGLFVDVGAHVGLISLAVARRRSDARVLAFEPSPANAAAWSVNRELNGLANAELIRAAVSDVAGGMAFHVDADSAAGHLAAGGTVDVDVMTLDDAAAAAGVTQVDVLKIDTEGGEMAVLEGAAGLLAANAVTAVVCELNAVHLARHGLRGEDITERLERSGLRQVALPGARRPRRRSATPAPLADVAFVLDSSTGTGPS